MNEIETIEPRFTRVEEMRLDASLEQEISNLLDEEFPVEFENRSFFQNRLHARHLAFHSDILLGHLGIAFRDIRLGETLVTIAGIADFAVQKKRQGQGIGTGLLQRALVDAKQSNAEIAALFGENSIYEKAGFVSAANKLTLVEMEGCVTKQVVQEVNKWFKILPLGDVQWDFNADVDLAGFAF